ncbi:MAG: GMC family oxidoreductase, partial [Candidatus Puniceispirillaceae bacterium]
GYADVLPYFRAYENRMGQGDDVYRGQSGEQIVTDLEWRHPLCDAFVEAAVDMGMPRNPDYNGRSQEGVSYIQRTTLGRRRVSAARAFLNPAKSRPNLKIITSAQTTKILFEGKRAIGVRYARGGRGGKLTDILAGREVILSSGVINSPHLLQVSGVGDAQKLKAMGIDLVHHLPGVGENLRDHFAPRFTARVKNIGTINEMSRGPKLWKEIAKYFLGKPSIVGLGPTLVYCFWHSDERIRNHDLQLTFAPASYKEGVQSQLDDEPGFTVAAWQQRPESLGYVRARSSDPFDAPIIQPNYLDNEEDRRVVLAGMKLSRKLMHSKRLAPYMDHEVYPGQHIQNDDELLQIARERGTTTYHQMGSCRMGPESDPTAVVDTDLKVYGLQGLRVIDASIMPTMLSSNLNAGALMIGEKGAAHILGKKLPAAEGVSAH